MSQQLESVYEFGPFRVDGVKRVLSREGEIIPLTLEPGHPTGVSGAPRPSCYQGPVDENALA